jgi:hypothetical protein
MDDGHLLLTRSLEVEVRTAFASQPRTEGLMGEALAGNAGQDQLSQFQAGPV